jgi:hypothetical protein
VTHVADLGGGGRVPGETSRSGETSRPSDIGRTTETGTAAESGRPITEASRTTTTARPADYVRAAESGRMLETGRPAAETSRIVAASAQPSESSRTPMERRDTVETRRTPDGSPPRRSDQRYRRTDDIDPAMYRVTEERRSNGTSYGWLWALPLAALAGLGLYFLRPTEQTPVTASRDIIQTTRDTVAALPDLKGPTLNAIQSLTTAVQGITDRTTATAALPRIQEASRDMERLATQSVQLPNEARTALANSTREPMTKLNTMLDTASNLPGVGPVLQPAIASLRGRMDAIAMVPGKPLFMASAPAEWVALSSFYNRDVLNRR